MAQNGVIHLSIRLIMFLFLQKNQKKKIELLSNKFQERQSGTNLCGIELNLDLKTNLIIRHYTPV